VADLARRREAAFGLRRLRDDGPRTEVLVFALGGELHAAAVDGVREILRSPPLTPVPRAPRGVLGVVSVRGRLVTVVDPRRALRLDAPPPTPRARIVLVEVDDGEVIGLFVDEVRRVERLSAEDIEPPAATLGGDVAAHVTGIARPRAAIDGADAGAALVLVDLAALVTAALRGG
jgi:purine-binding chemotaxis protein CheW